MIEFLDNFSLGIQNNKFLRKHPRKDLFEILLKLRRKLKDFKIIPADGFVEGVLFVVGRC